jgi:fluoride exporter
MNLTMLYVFIGGGIGSVLRFLIGWLITFKNFNPIFSTLISNVLASVLIAIICTITFNDKNSTTQIFWTTGFCGGLSTFSTFSFQSFQLFQQQQWSWLAFNVVSNLILTFLAVWIGYKMANS